MKLDKHIHELLFQHDCVIVPGLGGFIANYQSANFNPSLQMFYPPSKKVAFNSELKENDGLLAKYVSNKEACTYDEANHYINEYVSTTIATLRADKVIEIDKIGELRYSKENNIEFNPSSESNFLLTSFGLSPVQAPTIRRTVADKTSNQTAIPEEILVAPKSVNRNIKIKQPWKILEVVPIAALLFYIILFPGTANKINNGLSQLVPDTNFDFSRFLDNKSTEKNTEEESNSAVNENEDYATSGVYVDDENTSNLILPEDVIAEPIGESSPVKESDLNNDLSTEEIAEDKTDLMEDAKILNEPTAESTLEPVITETAKEEVKPISVKSTPVVNTIHATEKFHIIGGAFGVKSNADRYLNELITYGYKAQIIGKNKRGLHMVSVHSTNNRNDIQMELSKIKKVLSDKVWVFTN